jgi:hypothetical protein
MKGTCAYCGKSSVRVTREHAIPAALYPPSKTNSNVQRITIPACRDCNHGWSDDEAHFRNVLTVAGEPNEAARELWNGKIKRSFQKVDGRRRFIDLYDQMQSIQTDDGERHKVFPANDSRFLRILRKIARALHYYHGLGNSIPDEQVTADVLRFAIPEEFSQAMPLLHCEPDIFQYQFEVFDQFADIPISSFWLMTFFENRTFIASIWKPHSDLPAH